MHLTQEIREVVDICLDSADRAWLRYPLDGEVVIVFLSAGTFDTDFVNRLWSHDDSVWILRYHQLLQVCAVQIIADVSPEIILGEFERYVVAFGGSSLSSVPRSKGSVFAS